jgi:potassium voltage-gated channel Eag-related subfamily H protein 8
VEKISPRKVKSADDCQNTISIISDSLYLPELTKVDLLNVIHSMNNKKSTGLDGISASLLKRRAYYMIEPLLEIINASIKTGIFPSCLKKSVIKPNLKKGSTLDVNNYRPITLVPALSKILEKIISKWLLAFLEKHKILNPSQFGFRRNKYTKEAITFIVDNITESLNNKL